ncbi:hypothetical protein BO86DRAFT_437962 [Aspergillus japonicus CBS 114.51]|uniref:Uncharacterized protein n=1 Tax=Aspergillus japonicus CBS 114.51 TaxID=1448312 RepID=A0A8T8WSG9_ASPJA|nr:hypothetical protein BO86DRAFT_437962 [Aspergillus japonicus CBS 114.51]RAH78620.1 hypothetical protein BO86DRAFT_437962 [Aspergillus japonicus CBS 114.51]
MGIPLPQYDHQAWPSTRTQTTPSRQTLAGNAWLRRVAANEEELFLLQMIQNTYEVQLDDHPEMGYRFYMWLLWDYDRLWGIFDLGHTKVQFLIDSGLRSCRCNEEAQELQFHWRGVCKAAGDVVLCDEWITRGRLRINPWEGTFEGVFEGMAENGNPGEDGNGDRCAFHAREHHSLQVVPYYLEDVVATWNSYNAFQGRQERVRQFAASAEGVDQPR